MSLGVTAEKLQRVGVATLAVVATAADRARLFFRFRPPRVPVGADPDLTTHRAYGLPNMEPSQELWAAIQNVASTLSRELNLGVPPDEAYAAIDRLDGYKKDQSDTADLERHRAQGTGQFLVDASGTVRWANIECAREGLAGVDKFPADEELLAAARAL